MQNGKTFDRYRAAWVPDDDPERPWDEAAELAATWVRGQAQEVGGPPILVTATLQNGYGIKPLAFLYRGSTHVTLKSNRYSRPGSVLAYVPYAEELLLAARKARGTALCVVETAQYPVRGWAMVVGAVNLLNGEVLDLPDPLQEHLNRLKFNGNNGYADDFGKRQARACLEDIRADSFTIDADTLLAAMAGLELSLYGQKNLKRLVDKMRW